MEDGNSTHYPKGEGSAFGVNSTGTDLPIKSTTEKVNTTAPPIFSQRGVKATNSTQIVNSTRTMKLVSVLMEQDLHPNGNRDGIRLRREHHWLLPDRPLLALGRLQFVRRKPIGLRCLERSKSESTRFVAGSWSIVIHRPIPGRS